jgi:hypothetical protein
MQPLLIEPLMADDFSRRYERVVARGCADDVKFQAKAFRNSDKAARQIRGCFNVSTGAPKGIICHESLSLSLSLSSGTSRTIFSFF